MRFFFQGLQNRVKFVFLLPTLFCLMLSPAYAEGTPDKSEVRPSFRTVLTPRVFREYGLHSSSVRLANGQTVIQNSKETELCDSVRELLKAGANVNETLSDGKAPLHFASKLGSPKLVKLLLEYDADPNVQDDSGATPLHMSSSSPEDLELQKQLHRGIARSLLKAGADPMARTVTGVTPLHVLTGAQGLHRFEDPELAKVLLDAGADPNAVSECCGNTPLHLAVMFCCPEVVTALLKQGADTKIANRYKLTPLDMAKQRKEEKILSLIQAHGSVQKGASHPHR